MQRKRKTAAHIGSASILLIITVLCLISFAVLTMVNSKADYNLTVNLRDRQRVYYNACHEGNAFVAAINSGYDYSGVNGIIKKSIPITDNQSLDIAIMSNSTKKSANSKNNYRIIQWQIVNEPDSEYDYTLPVVK